MRYKYAQIQNNKVIQIIETTAVIDARSRDSYEWLDVTHATPQPNVGWRFNRSLGLFSPATEETINFETAKQEAQAAIDVAAGLARKRFITDIPGQAEVYREKYEQALDFLSCPGQVRYADYPLLEVDCKILDIPMKDIADNVVKRRSNWLTNMTAIESLRLSGKYNVDHCTNIQDVLKLKAHIIHKLTELA